MWTRRDETEKGFNDYIAQVKQDAQDDVLVSLFRFDSDSIREEYVGKDIGSVPALEDYTPGSLTPLYDAVAFGVRRTKEFIETSTRAFPDPKVLVVVLTDGAENCSQEETKDTFEALLKDREESEWTFMYLAASPDAWAGSQEFAGTTLAANTLQSTGSGRSYNTLYGTAAGATVNLTSAPVAMASAALFSDEDKDEVRDADDDDEESTA